MPGSVVNRITPLSPTTYSPNDGLNHTPRMIGPMSLKVVVQLAPSLNEKRSLPCPPNSPTAAMLVPDPDTDMRSSRSEIRNHVAPFQWSTTVVPTAKISEGPLPQTA